MPCNELRVLERELIERRKELAEKARLLVDSSDIDYNGGMSDECGRWAKRVQDLIEGSANSDGVVIA